MVGATGAVMATLFVPMEGAAPGEAGSLLYHVPADHQTRGAWES